MRKFCLAMLLLAGLLTPALVAQEVDNPGFEKGKTGWSGDGKVVYITAEGEVSDKEEPGSTPAIKVELSKSSWQGLKQRLQPKAKETEISYAVQVKTEGEYKRLAESREYSDVDFKEGGTYFWSAKVFPKCDFLIRVKDETWHYKPLSLKGAGVWKKIAVKISDLKSRQREIELLFPPGEGAVYLKGL